MSAPGKKKRCPYCDEEIPLSAEICRFCREELPAAKTAKKRSNPDQAEVAPERPARGPAARKPGSSDKTQPAPKAAPPPPSPLTQPWDDDDGPPVYSVEEEEQPPAEPPKRRHGDDDEDDDEGRPRSRLGRVSMVDEFSEDAEERRRLGKKSKRFARCPSCGSRDAKRVLFTIWGGLVGPIILSHVKCQRCGTKYNGRTGKDNTLGIIIYLGVGLVFGAMCGLAAVILLVMAR